MTSEMFAACPHCKAVFRLSMEKLEFKDGLVRCGACREVFNANWNLVEQTEDGFRATEVAEDADPNAFRPFAREYSDADDVQTDQQQPQLNEDIDLRAFDQNADQDNAGLYSEPSTDPESLGVHDDSDLTNQSDVHEAFLIDNEVESVDSTEAESSDEQQDQYREFIKNQDDGRSDLGLKVTVDERLIDQFEADFSEDSLLTEDQLARLDIGSGASEFIPDAEDRPSQHSINMHGVDHIISHKSNPLATLSWFMVCAGFLLLLGFQVKLFFVERYAQNEMARPYLEVFCRLASCTLPARQDLFRFTLTNTKIELHPTEPGALRVSVRLVNEAAFAQPYPDLQLTLTDRVGRVVGRRTFSPEAYLPDDQVNSLSAGQLGTIWFDLANPHEKAVGFVVDIVTSPGDNNLT
ncbi:MAG: DUF3426 domain-containing protein [Pseudomonadota bacterium]